MASATTPLARAQRAAPPDSPESFEGQTIASIQFPQDQPLENNELIGILKSQGISLRTPLHQEAVRAAIERLFLTGRFADIQVNAEPAAGGVTLQFLTKNAWFIGRVAVTGGFGAPPNPGQLVNAARLDLGTAFDPAMVAPAEAAIVKLLVSNGYYEAAVTHELDYSTLAQQVNITFHVSAGHRARYTTPSIQGSDLVLTPARIIKSTGWHNFIIPGWRQVTQKRTGQGVRNVRLRYDKSNRLFASVQLASLDYDKTSRTAKPALSVDAGPTVKIETEGKKISRRMLKDNVPVFEEHAVDRDLLQEGANNLRDELQAAGYFDAEVTYSEPKPVGNTREIDFVITPGERHKLVSLTITGNHYFTTKTIRERLFMQTASLQFLHGRYSDAFLRRDKESIENLYRANGFRDVSVTSALQDDYKNKKGSLAVTLTINEGRQWIVSHLEVTGYSKLNLGRLVPTFNSSEDQPFSEFNIAADREQILNQYFENGFPNAQFNWTSTPGVKANEVNLKYSITEGQQQFVRQVIYSGLHTTRPALVDRQISLSPGDALSPAAMSDIQRRMYNLGIFASVDTAVQNADGDTQNKYVLYDIDEAHRYTITGGVGAEFARIGGSTAAEDLSSPGGATGFSPLLEFDVSRINLFGLGHTISLRTRYATFDKRAQLSYLWPRFFNSRKLDFTASLLYDDAYDVRTFSARREAISLQWTDRISKPLTAFFRIDYRNVNVSNLKIDPLLIPLLSQTTRTGLVAVNVINDRRDDPTDAHKGMYDSIDFGVASHVFGGRNNFLRILGRNATYTRIGEKWVFARQTEFGILPTYGKPPVTSSEDLDPIPLAERFYGGGADTLRGFPQNQAGPRDLTTGFPLGGSALFFNNTELRFPLIGDNIGAVLFEDFGNVFDKPGDITFSIHQPHPGDPTDFNYMVHAAGFGIRYRTPIGPVRADLAYSINPPKYYGFSGSFTDLVNCTATNTCTRELQQISHFQFFFSIGQTF